MTNTVRKAIDTYVADFTQGTMDNNKLIIHEVRIDIPNYRNWFSTSYDNQDNVLYLHGGEYNTKQLTGKV